MTTATITTKPDETLLRIRFPEGVMAITYRRDNVRITTSSPSLIALIRRGEPLHAAFETLKAVLKETGDAAAQMERLRRLAEQASDLTEFVKIVG